MAKATSLLFGTRYFLPLVFAFLHIVPDGVGTDQENHPPVVTITAPANNSAYEWNTPVNYAISVSDKEDGESKFEEIASGEVFLEVRYVADTAGFFTRGQSGVRQEHQGLSAIRGSNCLNCHAFRSKLIGPSFYEVNRRYPATKANEELLIERIRKGSSGIWGSVSMPTHPELSTEEMSRMVNWIFKNGAASDVNYYSGTAGSFRMEAPATSATKGFLVLTASYTDHGAGDDRSKALKSEDVVVLRIK